MALLAVLFVAGAGNGWQAGAWRSWPGPTQGESHARGRQLPGGGQPELRPRRSELSQMRLLGTRLRLWGYCRPDGGSGLTTRSCKQLKRVATGRNGCPRSCDSFRFNGA